MSEDGLARVLPRAVFHKHQMDTSVADIAK